MHGYKSTDTCLTVADIKDVLTSADDDDAVHFATLGTGETSPVKTIMVSDDEDHRVYIYTERPL